MLFHNTRNSTRRQATTLDQRAHELVNLLGQPVRQALRDAQAALDQHVADLQLTPQPTPGGVIAVATPQPEAPPQATTITFGAPRFIADQLGAAARAFNQANPKIFVKIEPDDAPGASSRLADAAALSDCFAWSDPPGADDFATLLDLQPLIDADAGFQAGDYPPPLLAPFKHEAGLYGLPSMVSFRALHYNANAFDAAGVARPTAAWTLDDLLNAARQLTSGSGAGRRYGFGGYSTQTGEVFFFLDRLGAAPATGRGETIRPNFTDPRVVRAIGSYLDLLRAASPNTRLQGYRRDDLRDDAYDAIAAGHVGMWLAFGDRFLDRGPAQQPDFAWAIAPPPLGDSAVTSNDFRVQGIYISAKTLHAAACWSWLKQLSADPAITQGGFPARRSLAESSAFLDQAPPGAAAVYRAYLAAFDRPLAPDSPDESFSQSAIDYYWFFRAIDRALHRSDLERELADAQALTEQYLACVRGGAAGSVCAIQVDPDYQGLQRAVAGSG